MNDVRIHRAQKNADHPYAMILKTAIEDNRLSWEARGILCYVLAKPDNWQIMLRDLYQNGPAKRDKVRRIINELVDYGYFERVENDRDSGQFTTNDYIVYESPPCRINRDGKTATVKPRRLNRDGKTATVNRTRNNNEYSNNTINNKQTNKNGNGIKNDDDEKHARTLQVDEDINTHEETVVVAFDPSIQKLMDYGIREEEAKTLLDRHGHEYLLEKVQVLEQRIESGVEINSTSGFLMRAINDDWQPKVSKKIDLDSEEARRKKYIPDKYKEFIQG